MAGAATAASTVISEPRTTIIRAAMAPATALNVLFIAVSGSSTQNPYLKHSSTFWIDPHQIQAYCLRIRGQGRLRDPLLGRGNHCGCDERYKSGCRHLGARPRLVKGGQQTMQPPPAFTSNMRWNHAAIMKTKHRRGFTGGFAPQPPPNGDLCLLVHRKGDFGRDKGIDFKALVAYGEHIQLLDAARRAQYDDVARPGFHQCPRQR